MHDTVFIVFAAIPNQGEYIRGVYLSAEEAEARKKILDDDPHDMYHQRGPVVYNNIMNVILIFFS